MKNSVKGQVQDRSQNGLKYMLFVISVLIVKCAKFVFDNWYSFFIPCPKAICLLQPSRHLSHLKFPFQNLTALKGKGGREWISLEHFKQMPFLMECT